MLTGESHVIRRFDVQVITGHSERRVGFGEGGENSELVAEKTKVRFEIRNYHPSEWARRLRAG